MPSVLEYESALERDPSDTEAFVALRKAYRQAKQHDRLIVLYEKRAQAIDDGAKAAELFYLASELRLDQLGDVAGAEADLANAVHRDPNHIRAAARLKDLYREQDRTTDYMVMLEVEAAAVSRTRDPSRLAELQSEMKQLFVNHFTVLEKTLRAGQRKGKLTKEDVKAIESARKIYRALGDYRSVVRLYDLELEGTTEPKRRGDLLLGLGRVLAEKLEELDAAAHRLAEVIRLRPRDEKALELLASIYANPNWIGADGGERAAGIYHQLARRQQEAGDIEGAIGSLRKALAASPGHAEAAELVERTYYEAGRLSDLDRYYRERVQSATTAEEQLNFLYKRAQLAEGDLGDTAEAQRIYGEIAGMEDPGGPASERLAELFLGGHEFAKLAELREKQLGAIEDPPTRVRLMGELAALYADRLGDRDQAAVYLHAILQIEPTNPQALAAYADHFRDKSDWLALADLLEFAYEQARAANEPADALVTRLEEIAAVVEKNLGNAERALFAWQRIEELNPRQQRARDMQKRLLLKSKDFARIVPVLEREAELADELGQRVEILRRVAQIHREKLGSPERALEIYRELLQLAPDDQVALRAMVEIYERGGDAQGLATTLRMQVGAAATKPERVSLLRRLLLIYDDDLNDVDAASWAASEILTLVPGDRDTLTRLEEVLERAGDHAGLVRTLDDHAEHTSTVEERVQILTRAAEALANHLSDLPGAALRWEAVLAVTPESERALEALATLYTSLERWRDLARVVEAEVHRLAGDPQRQAEALRRLADIAETRLGDQPRAERAWRARLEILPSDLGTLEALARIYGETHEWRALVSMLERQIPLVGDSSTAVAISLRRAEILETDLGEHAAAIEAFERLVAELDPNLWEAHERLRGLYERAGNWERVVKVAERQLFLTEAEDERLRRALEIGALWRDRLGDPGKAIDAYERALEINGSALDAMRALQPLYEGARAWNKRIEIDQRILALTSNAAARQELLLNIGNVYEERLGDPQAAFAWYRRAHVDVAERGESDPEALRASFARLDALAEKHGLFEELIEVYTAKLLQVTERPEQLATVLEIARICEGKLSDPARAFTVLHEALSIEPSGRELAPHLERLAEVTQNWLGLLDVYARLAGNRTERHERVRLLHLRAAIKERRLGDASGALDEHMRCFVIDPKDSETQHEILRLAERTGRWEDALKVQAQLFALAGDLVSKLAIARHAAVLVETEVKDLVRAFRAYLNAFRLAPEDEDVGRQIWRLAGLIGRYTVPTAALAATATAAATVATAGAADPVVTGRPATAEEADDSAVPTATLVEDTVPVAQGLAEHQEPHGAGDAGGGDQGDGEVDVDDAAVLSVAVDTESSGILEEIDPAEWAVAAEDADADAEGNQQDEGQQGDGQPGVADARAMPNATADATEWPASAKSKTGTNGVHPVNGAHGGERAPAPPPPPRPTLSARTGTPPPVPMGGGPGAGWGTGATVHPTIAAGPRVDPADGKLKPAAQPAPRFETPWQELAQAYEVLPAADPTTRLRYLLKESEVWERGEKNTDRALVVLDRAFRLNAGDPVVRATLERIAGEHDRWDQVCRIYLGGIDGFAPAEHAVSIHLDVARFREALGQIDQAEERYQAILNLQPDQPHAILRMEEITRSQERWAELAAVLERRVSGPAPIAPGPDRRAKMTELAGLYERALEKPYEAIDTLERLVGEAAESDGADSGESRPTEAPEAAGATGAPAGSSDPRAPLDSQGGGPPARAASDVAARAETIAACEALGRLYGRVGLWVKVVDTLQREAELTSDPVAARAVRIRIADVYERELGQADRAIEAFEAIRALDSRDAEALAALDRLYESHARWDDLQEILARRAELAADETEHLDLVRRRARILEERLGNPEAAAGALRALGPVALADRELGAALVRNLRRAGLSHEAARTLGNQVEGARTSGVASSAIVPLLLELSAVRADDLADPAGARQAIAVALEISPEEPNALAALAELALKENDFVTYAATRRREARARLTASEAVAALLDAGRAYREQANLPAEARACFEEALAREPTSVDALRALAALHAAAGEWTAARDRLLRQLELVEGAEFRAAVLTDLARSVWEGSGEVAEAQRYVDEALELMPDHLPAVLAAADIYYKEGQWSAAERRLTEAIRRLRHQPDHASRLHLRLAEVTERLGRADESFRQLSESDRLTPGQLSTRLAMGENRFRAGKWREASALLGPLAEHADAVRHAAAVADGLGHAAEAELKLRRPEKSLALYQAALALEAEHPPSLRAMADLALERGEKSAARLFLERLAASPSADREMKVGVLEQLGDLYLEAGESLRARAAYEAAIALFEEPKDLLVSVLEKALQLQREADDFEAATHSASLLIDLVQDPKERALRRREAAMLIAARGEGEEALRLLEAACADNPEDDTVLSSLCDLLTRQGKQKQVAKRLATVLPGLPAPEDTREARGLRANLWERLGEARRKRSVAEAVAAFERAVELDPERMSARIALATLYGPRIEYADAALVNLRRLAEADPARVASVRALGEAFAKRGMIDPARCAFELLEVLGGMEEGPRRFLKTHPTPEMKPDDPYAGVLDDGDRRVLAGREAAILSEVFSLLWEGAPHPSGPRLDDLGVAAEDKLSPMSDLDVAKVYGQVAKMLGNKRTALYLKRQDVQPRTAELLVQTPPALVFGGLLEQVPLPEARFEIARGLELSRPEYILAAAIRPKQFTELFGTVLRAFHPRHAKRRSNTLDAAAEAASTLRKNVPYKISKRLAEIFQEVGSTSWSSVKWRKVVAETANRTGLLAAGDLRAALPAFLRANQLALPMPPPPPPPAPPGAGAVASVGGPGSWSPDADPGTAPSGPEVVALAATSEALRDWLRFALSDEYFRLREKLGTAAVQAAAA